MLSVTCEAHPAIQARWVTVYWETYRKRGLKDARAYFFRHVPDECKPAFMAAIKRGPKP